MVSEEVASVSCTYERGEERKREHVVLGLAIVCVVSLVVLKF